MQFAILSSQCSPLPLPSTSSSKSLSPSPLYTKDHCLSSRRHKFFFDPLVASTIGIVFFQSTSSTNNQCRRTYHVPSYATQGICIEETHRQKTLLLLPRAHALMCHTHFTCFQQPSNVILLTSTATLALAYVSLCHHLHHLVDVIAPLLTLTVGF